MHADMCPLERAAYGSRSPLSRREDLEFFMAGRDLVFNVFTRAMQSSHDPPLLIVKRWGGHPRRAASGQAPHWRDEEERSWCQPNRAWRPPHGASAPVTTRAGRGTTCGPDTISSDASPMHLSLLSARASGSSRLLLPPLERCHPSCISMTSPPGLHNFLCSYRPAGDRWRLVKVCNALWKYQKPAR